MPKFAFELGREKLISISELEAVLNGLNIKERMDYIGSDYIEIELPDAVDINHLMFILGGTISISKEIAITNSTTDTISNQLRTNVDGKVSFCVRGQNARAISLEIKRRLKSEGMSVRYVEYKNTATIIHNHLIDKQTAFTIIGSRLFYTVAVQPIEEFSARDYKRPAADSKSGMLPPKLARLMINLSGQPLESAILDPFCGSGTVLVEAIDLGFTKIIGCDLSKKAIEDSTANVTWFAKKQNLSKIPAQIFEWDATQINSALEKNSIDAVVTEPYMGNPIRGYENAEQIRLQARELAKLYIASFKALKEVLKPNGLVIFIFPSFNIGAEEIKVDCVKEIKQLGFLDLNFGQNQQPLTYRRPGQHVTRNIWRWKKLR